MLAIVLIKKLILLREPPKTTINPVRSFPKKEEKIPPLF